MHQAQPLAAGAHLLNCVLHVRLKVRVFFKHRAVDGDGGIVVPRLAHHGNDCGRREAGRTRRDDVADVGDNGTVAVRRGPIIFARI